MADPDFEALYQQKLDDLRAEIYGSGVADDVLAAWVAVLVDGASELIDEATVNAEAASIAELFS